jgi:hypothetical protein
MEQGTSSTILTRKIFNLKEKYVVLYKSLTSTENRIPHTSTVRLKRHFDIANDAIELAAMELRQGRSQFADMLIAVAEEQLQMTQKEIERQNGNQTTESKTQTAQVTHLYPTKT